MQNSEAGPDCSRLAACLYIALFVPIITAIVLANSGYNARIGDTLILISEFESLERFSSLWSNVNADPLQALFDIFPSGHRLDAIPNIIAHALLGPGWHTDFFLVFCAALLTLSVALMARTVGMRWGVAVLAGILLPLLIMPTFGYIPFAEDMYALWPILYYSAAGAVLVTALFWRIDGRSWPRSVLFTVTIIAVLLHLSIIQIFHMTMMAPAMMAMGIGALAARTTRRELMSKVVCAVVIVAALAGAGIFQYLYATGINGAQYVFFQELPNFGSYLGPRWDLIANDLGEIFYTSFSPSYGVRSNLAGAVIVPLSQLGAVYLALAGRTRVARIFGRTMVVWIVATALIILFIQNFFYYTGRVYLGPDPRDFIEILWPYYVICLAGLVFAVVEGTLALVGRGWSAARGVARYWPHGVMVAGLVVPVALLGARYTLHWTFANEVKFLMPPDMKAKNEWIRGPERFNQRNPLVDYLEPRSSVGLGRPFQGSVIFMPSVYDKDLKPYGVWRRENVFTYARWYLGNDLGEYGLRYYNIPTFDEITHNITPQFYLTVRELLSRPGIDIFERHYGGAATRLNQPIMELLGLHYILADYRLPFGAERLAVPIPEAFREMFEALHLLKSPIRIFELPDPNVGNYSPINVVRAKTAKDSLLAMARPDFDGRQTVVTGDPSLPDDLIPATGATMTVRLGGVALSASSTGQSILVLPVQYSHCWRIVSGGGATLFRANLMQLGVRFSGDLRVELRQIYGPFWQSECRIEDAADAKRLDMVDALGAVAAAQKVPGNGVNLIPSPEALDTVIGDSPMAAIEPVSAPDVPLREYTITAQGGAGEHYAALELPKLSPGVYTLSLQVRNKDARFLSLQMKDGANNGALVDYLVPTGNVWIYPIGKGDRLEATVQKIDDRWSRLTLTSTLTTETGNHVFIHIKDKGNNGGFTSNGEAVTIRAVKLEQGEVATPYVAPQKIVGDGVNLIPSPEALDTAIGNSAIAAIKSISAPGEREYTITAQGGATEHYATLNLPKLTPGVYTLSLQVQAKDTRYMALQMKDGANNGVLVDYLVPARKVWINRIGEGDKLAATVEKIDDNWDRLTLTSTVSTETGDHIFIHLKDAKNNGGFTPNGEAVTVRAVKLERGEVATPYGEP